jgi:hypothetical protein
MNHAQQAHALVDTYRGLFKALPKTIRIQSCPRQRYAGWCVWESHKPREVRIKLASFLFRPDHCRELVLTILHELLHAEQAALGLDMEHNLYFAWRSAELTAATGVHQIYDPEYDS